MHILIVGARGVGKSTLIDRVLKELGCAVSGFETKKEDALADAERGIPIYLYPAGRPHRQTEATLLGYSRERHPVALPGAFDRAVNLLTEAETKGEIIKMDELGFLESGSPAFCRSVLRCLDGDKPVIAAVKEKDTPFLLAVRNHPKCRCFPITEENRDALLPVVTQFAREELERV